METTNVEYILSVCTFANKGPPEIDVRDITNKYFFIPVQVNTIIEQVG